MCAAKLPPFPPHPVADAPEPTSEQRTHAIKGIHIAIDAFDKAVEDSFHDLKEHAAEYDVVSSARADLARQQTMLRDAFTSLIHNAGIDAPQLLASVTERDASVPRYITCFDEHLIKLLEEKEIAQSSAKADDIAVSRPGATTRSISRKASQQQSPSPEHHDDTVIDENAAKPEQGIEHHADHGPAITGVDEHTLLDTGPHHSTTLEFNLESRKVTTDSMPMSYYSMISEIKNNMDHIWTERSEVVERRLNSTQTSRTSPLTMT